MKTCRLVTSIGVLALLAGCAVLGEGMSNNNPPDIKSENVHFVIANSNNGGPELSITNLRNAKCTKFPDQDRYRKGCVFAALNEMVIARSR